MSKSTEPTLKETLLESAEDISDLIKTAAHRHRLQILALLTDGPREFASLLDAMKLSKTALANHLTHMMKRGLLERYERGMYQITKDGKDLLQAIATFYINSKAREINQIEHLKKQYSKGYKALEMEEKTVANPPLIQDAWLTYIGAVAGVLQWLGVDCDVTDVGGYSGYTFLVNVANGKTCPSGPTAHSAWGEIHKGTESLGWKLHSFADERPFPLSSEVTPEDRERAWNLFEMIKKEIKNHDKPVVLWGIPVPEYGIVTGYKGDSYITSTVGRFLKKPEPPIRYDALQSPGCMEAIFFAKEIPVPETRDKEALARALKMAEGTFTMKGYTAGPAAYDEWAAVLETGDPEKVDSFGNNYTGACIHDARKSTAHFLERIAKKYKESSQTAFLGKASKEYSNAEKLLSNFVDIFPFPPPGETTLETCKKGAEILRTVKQHEIAAITNLKKAYQNWE